MKEYRKRIISAVLAAAMAFSSVGITAYAEGLAEGESGEVSVDGSVSVNAANFPDEIFRSYVSDNFDSDGDGGLSAKEIQNATVIDLARKGISDLKGIEFFTSLRNLDCERNLLTSLDLSKNTALETLSCSNNQLTSLNVSKNTSLTKLSCWDNQFTSLDVSGCTALTELSCGNNLLTSLDISKNAVLTHLFCDFNQLSSIDVSNNTALKHLSCVRNQLSSLDVSNNTALTNLSCFGNQLTSLDVKNNTMLTDLDCSNNQITNLDLSKNTALIYLSCDDNQLTSLDLSKNTALGTLYCRNNNITSLNVKNNTVLTVLMCYNNLIKSIDISSNKKLNRFFALPRNYTISSKSLDEIAQFGFDPAKASNWIGADYDSETNSLENISTGKVSFDYLLDYFETKTFTINVPYPKTNPPSKPANVKATAGDKQVTLSWTTATGATSYTIYRCDSGKYTKINSTTKTTYTVTGLTNGTEYKFLVRAFNENGGSAFTTADLVSATPKAAVTAVPAKPTNVKATAGDKQVTLTWTAAEGAASYTIYRCDSGKYTKINSTTKTTHTVTGLTNGTEYKFLVRAFNTAGGNSFTTADLVSATPKGASATVPAKPTVSANMQDKVVTFSWNAVSGATYYKLYNYSGGKYGLIATVTDTTYRLRYLKNGTTYKVLVRAFNDKGGSKFTTADLISVTPKAATAVPTAPSVKASVSGGNVNLTWAHIPTAFSYTIYKYENGTYTKLGATCDNYFTVKGLAAGKTYSILVRAFNSKGGHKVTSSNRVSVTL